MSAIPSPAFPFERRWVEVKGSRMAFVDEGRGPVLLFLHGNPTSSFLWRNVLPFLLPGQRLVAPDLIGMGASDRPEIDYSFADHAAHLDAFIHALALRDIVLVGHDWGAALAMRYARLNEANVRGLVVMEAMLPPTSPAASLAAMGEGAGMFEALRTPGIGERMILEENFFVEVVLRRLGCRRELDEPTMAAYRAPFPTPSSRRPMLAWVRQIPIGGEPPGVAAVVRENGEWFCRASVPKLLLHAEPGALNPPPVVDYLAARQPRLETRCVGAGLHFIQEDQPRPIGLAIADWLRRLG